MIRALLPISSLGIAACSQAPEVELVRLGDEVRDLVWGCQEEVLAGANLLDSETCKQFSEQHQKFTFELRDLELQYQDTFEFEAREALGWPREDYFPCSRACWKARAYAGYAQARFRRLITISKGCDHFAHTESYFSPSNWENIKLWQERNPCEPKAETVQ